MNSAHGQEVGDEQAPLLEASQPSRHNTFTAATINETLSHSSGAGKKRDSDIFWLLPERIHDVFQKMTWSLFFIWMLTSITNIMFGYASTSFSGLQSIPSFTHEFGTPSDIDGSYVLSASKVSFMSSIGLAGKLVGTLVGPLQIERFGHTSTLLVASLLSLVGIAIGCASHTVTQFVASRVIIYFTVGVVEVATPMYQAEIVPASMRGTVVGSLQLFNQIGQILSASVNRVYYRSTVAGGWIVPVAVQAVFPLAFIVGLYFIPASPRWLISKSRKEDAIASLENVRPQSDVRAGLCRAEADAIEDALHNKLDKGSWTQLFRGTNRRRTRIVVCVLALQQLTGQGFVSQYSPRFYKTVGLGDKGFNYNIASAFAGWSSCFIGTIFSDVVGRRDVLIWGGLAQTLFLFLVPVFGTSNHPSSTENRGLVASVILFVFVFTGTWAPISYALASELGTASLREKTMGLGIAFNVICAFTVSFSVPYLLDGIGANIGWLFGGVAIIASTYAFFFVPETKYRSLEEMDELFAADLWARQFENVRTFGAGRRVTQLENEY